jgi:hypothetical protein
VAALYADSGSLDSEAINLEAIETLVRVSGMAVELLAGRTAPVQQVAAPQPAPAEEAAAEEAAAEEPQGYEQPSYAPTAEYDEITPVVEESAPAPEVTEFEPQPEPQQVQPQPEFQPESWAEAQPESQPEAGPAVETPAPAATPRRRYGADVELPVEVSSEEERRLHSDARRFARLLVSEIKLYNEQKVTEGRSQGDLYPRLREYIDRSREMYDKRVKPEVAQRYDYFHHELVNTLAEGDEAKLGNAYPGATVSA